ncbi:MAG: restriction endonuclease subunit S [Bacteroidaceae bacterium]|nr:restriction endonuclease subunit S [Bacteroidaceae bacterium]
MQLTKYKLGDLIVQRREKNKDYDLPIRGVSREGFIKPKVEEADTSIYNVFYKNDFVFNPARMELNSIALNLELDKALCSSLYEVFYVKDENVVLPEFLNLHIKRDEFARHCDYIGLGSAREYCRFANIAEFDIKIPPIEVQREIVKADRQIKRRIRLNEQMIEKLEATAQALYRKMFVDGIDKENLPEGWKVGKLEDICDCFDSKRKPVAGYDRDKMDSSKRIYPYYGAAALMDYVDDYIFDGDYILMGEDGTVMNDDYTPVIQYVRGKFWVNNHAHILKGKNGFDENLLYLFLKQTNVKDIVTGGVQAKINQENMMSIPAIIPPHDLIKELRGMENPIFREIHLRKQENSKLSQLQSLLLAKMGNLKQ